MTATSSVQRTIRAFIRSSYVSAAVLIAACWSNDTSTNPIVSLTKNPCTGGDAVSLASLQSVRIDCANSGTTVTLAGGGANYLIVPEFATSAGTNQLVSYRLFTGAGAAADMAPDLSSLSRAASSSIASSNDHGLVPASRPNRAQVTADRLLLARAHARLVARGRASLLQPSRSVVVGAASVPAVGSVRSFHVLSNLTSGAFRTVGATLAYAGANVLVYVDTLAPPNGFTPAQLQNFGQYFDQTLYGIATTAFGAATDVDQNGHVIMLMSPVVNADTPASTCTTQGFVGGFFLSDDFDGPSDPNSNQGEIFYSIVPDPSATVSCAHTVDALGQEIPATFLHELQHLINYGQHVVAGGGNEGASWLDEGLSIVAEELGSLYWENKCPPPACRTNSAQIFPDSAQGFVQSFLYDSYQYALMPDTASLTLHVDSDDGFAWRGGDWLLVRWLADHSGATFLQQLERGASDGVTSIEQATGRSFPSLFADFGLSLYADSLPGLPRATAPASIRFTTRNVKQLWARLYATSAGSSDVPRPDPLQLFAVTSDSTLAVMNPGTTTFFRLNTPASAPLVTIEFSGAGGSAFSAALHPQLAILRLPPGQ